MKKGRVKKNKCTNSEMAQLFRRRAETSDPVAAKLLKDSLGSEFSELWDLRRREIGQGYAALLCSVLECDTASVQADDIRRVRG